MRIAIFVLSPLLYLLSFVFPKTKKIWLFGGWFGKRYADNSKDFFEYCNNERPDAGLRYVWIYKDKELGKKLSVRPLETKYAYSLEGIWLQLRAKVFVTCINSSDFIPFLVTRRNFFVQLWHGSPLKHIGVDSRKTGLRKAADKLRFFLIDKYDLIISPAPIIDNIFESAFCCSKKNLFRAGYPRNENFNLKESTALEIRQNFGLGGTDRLVAYLPTHRQEGKGNNPFKAELMKLLLQNEKLREKGIYIVVKPHFYEKDSLRDIREESNVLIRYDLGLDLYEFLGATDALITDYSSIILDYELLGKEIHIYPFDFEEYTSNDRGLYHDFDEIYSAVKNITKSDSIDELILNLDNIKISVPNFSKENTTYNLPFGPYSKTIFEELLMRLKI